MSVEDVRKGEFDNFPGADGQNAPPLIIAVAIRVPIVLEIFKAAPDQKIHIGELENRVIGVLIARGHEGVGVSIRDVIANMREDSLVDYSAEDRLVSLTPDGKDLLRRLQNPSN
ncbi:hypothetical protein EDD96_4517 [Streptomyces sp. Ag109_G2-6]|uniref:hypothetical protein n=1 Tax=Streptomyces TaxID=1883 RepID=UPI000F4F04DD|nr:MULTISPECIES: hypothetical protein [Streptomyces]RPF40741.1 hypothetical protein EDD96_4517 [Streptomyces sp. Ag109_G2-6]